jgi:hypothetical protein
VTSSARTSGTMTAPSPGQAIKGKDQVLQRGLASPSSPVESRC